MTFTITTRGRAIGVTDLAFDRVGGRSRSGWFYPDAEGEKVMPVIASVIPAMRAYLHRDVPGEDARPIVQPRHLPEWSGEAEQHQPDAAAGSVFARIIRSDTDDVEDVELDEDDGEWPRYQVHITLVDDSSIP